MKQKVFARSIQGQKDMAELESTVGSLLGGEDNKCSLIRSSDFVQLRLRALYGRGVPPPVHVYGEGLQISLDQANVASVFLLSVSAEDDVILGKKRSEPDSERSPDRVDHDLARLCVEQGACPSPEDLHDDPS
jgi:hypothetical protein